MPDRIAVFACEPQPIVVEALHRIISESVGLRFAGSAVGLGRALRAICRSAPDIVLIDESFGFQSAAEFLKAMATCSPRSRAVLWVTEPNGGEWVRAFELGACAVLRKTAPVQALLDCLAEGSDGRLWLGDEPFDQGRGAA